MQIRRSLAAPVCEGDEEETPTAQAAQFIVVAALLNTPTRSIRGALQRTRRNEQELAAGNRQPCGAQGSLEEGNRRLVTAVQRYEVIPRALQSGRASGTMLPGQQAAPRHLPGPNLDAAWLW